MINLLIAAAATFWLVIPPEGARDKWDVKPKPEQVPANSKIIEIPKGTADEDLNDLQLDGTIVKPVAPVSVVPQVQKMQDAIFADLAIPLEAKVEIIKYFPLLDKYAYEPAKLQAAWVALKSVYGKTWLSEDLVNKIEQYAAACNVEITP